MLLSSYPGYYFSIIDPLKFTLNMNGGSYRLKETKEWLAGQEKEEKDGLN